MKAIDDNGWEEVRIAAEEMFTVWEDGAELEWAEEAWQHLYAAGLVGGESALETTASNLRLVTLARVYQEFCGLVWDVNPDTPIAYLAENLEIDPVALGILAAMQGVNQFEECADELALHEAALIAASDGQRIDIADCLKKAYGGDAALYSRLWHTRSADADAEDDGEGDENADSSANSFGLNYVMNGFQNG
jgi:hypothetical protein